MGWRSQIAEPLTWIAGKFSERGPNRILAAPRDILVLRPSDLGDLLTTTPIFEALHRRFPDAKVVAGIGSWGRPIVEHNPFVDEIVELDLPWSNKFVTDQSGPALLRFLSGSAQLTAVRERRGFDIGIDVLGSHIGVLTLIRLGARYRVGLRGYRGGWSACQQAADWAEDVHVARMALRQAETLGATDLPDARPQIYLTSAERDAARRFWIGNGRRIKLVVNCGGGQPEKVWPSDRLRQALRIISDALESTAGRPDIILVGGPADRPRAEQVMVENMPGLRSVCGETSLRATFALTEQADLVLTNASMLLHVAAAFHRPTVAVLGGMHADQAGHDRLWGYAPPYSSVGVATPGQWPAPEEVARAVLTVLLGVQVPA